MQFVERLESRRLLTTYLVDTSAALAAVNAVNLAAGDVVLLRGGSTINGKLSFDAGDQGTAANPIRVSSYDPATGLAVDPAAAASARATLHAGNGDGIAVTNTAGIEITALNVVGAGRTVNTGSGIRFVNSQAGNTKLKHLRVDHVDVGGFRNFGINLVGAAGKSGFENVRFTYVSAHDNGQAGIATQGVFSASSTAYAHRDVYVGYSETSFNTGIVNFSSNSGNGIVLADVDLGTIEHNVASFNGALNTHDGGPIGMWAWDATNITIQYNESHHNRTNSDSDGGGFGLDGGVTNSVVQYNYSHDNDGAGLGLYQFRGARPWANNTFRFNLSVNDGRKNGYGGISIWNGDTGGAKLRNARLFNNTVVIDSAGANRTPYAVRFLSSNLTSVHFANNNLVTRGSAGFIYQFSNKGNTDLRFLGNNYFGQNTFTMTWNKKQVSSLTAWRSTGAEKLSNGTAVGTSQNPSFQDGTSTLASGYQLQSASPLASSGVNLWSVLGIEVGEEDLFGTIIPAAPLTYSVGVDWM